MSDNTTTKDASGASVTIATDDVGGVQHQLVKMEFGPDGAATQVSSEDPLPTGDATAAAKLDTVITALASAISAIDTVTAALSEALSVEGIVSVSNLPGTQAVYGPLTDAELRASAVHVEAVLPEPVVGNITSATGIVAIDVSRASNIGIQVLAASGVGGAAMSCEMSADSTDGSDGTWVSTQIVRTNGGTIATGITGISSVPSYGWRASVSGYKWFRLRAYSGTFGTLTMALFPAVYGSDPVPAGQDINVASTLVSTTPQLYTEGTTALGSGVTLYGTTRDAGSTPSYQTFVANAYADVAGTLYLEKALSSGGPWVPSAPPRAVAAGEAQEVSAKITTRYNRARFVNGATAQGAFALTTAYHRV